MNEVLGRTPELAKGSEFLMPIRAFKCSLCGKIFRTEADAHFHFLGKEHNCRYEEMVKANPAYEHERTGLSKSYLILFGKVKI